ncbi:hypothetical protein A5844_002181 [Enterococcus sp. 10A9_DIV0425]|uniref:Uncharacterized protein n=1 Tax=Candidatus Enterococcus wittei TaxID=1987383 RepID=A0A242JZX1_9ENTE|nr:hypothetical protein [Enterococcus sp. 10A9_DIV0425]OTP10481.1 hypothetical protein A5844_002181 [Enterococcus sp. 10A9_DIV0425]THE12894.1 hypothetical protein E1H99_06760 [Enterococcus hirae]
MYVLPICLLIMAIVFLGIQIHYFLIQYKKASTFDSQRFTVYMNYIGLISALSTAILSIIYIFIINNQL